MESATPPRDTAGAMSEENVEIAAKLRRGYDAYNRCDFDAAMESIHPEFEFVPAGGQPPIRRAAAFRAWMEPEAFESQVLEPLAIRFNGNKALIRLRATIRGAGSGIEADFIAWAVWTFDAEQRMRRLEVYLDGQEAEALEAAGLSE
jgi:Domain of unknown function (DUF4440)